MSAAREATYHAQMHRLYRLTKRRMLATSRVRDELFADTLAEEFWSMARKLCLEPPSGDKS